MRDRVVQIEILIWRGPMKKSFSICKCGIPLLVTLLFLSSCHKAITAPETQLTSTEQTSSSISSSESALSSADAEESTSSSDQDPISPGFSSASFISADDDLALEFKKLPGVTKVERRSAFNQNQYILSFDMPIDHNDPGKGTFTQRMYVYYKDKDAPNMFNVGGYDLYYGSYDGDFYDEMEPLFAKTYNCNFFEAEYRFDGLSKPQGFQNEKTDYWEYLTCAQASEDFHTMIESMKTLFSGKWCFEGMSKGGEFTAYHLSRYPDDADLFLAECAMLNLGQNTPGLCEYVYSTAGDDRYGKEKAQEYRDLLLEFQVEMIKHRDDLEDKYYDLATNYYSVVFAPAFTKEILFDCTVLDARYVYQYDSTDAPEGDYFKRMKEVLDLKDANGASEKAMFVDKACDLLTDLYGPWQYAYSEHDTISDPESGNLYGFLFQCFFEDGYYNYDFSYLRQALEKDGSGASLYITEEMEPDVYGYRIPEHHKNLFSYSPDVRNARLRAVENTTTPLILVNGLSDIYQAAEIKESKNPNTHIFNIPSSFHDECTLDYLSEEQFKEYDAIVREALGI